ncbi:MAG TPA: hypothetical protein VFB59_01165 [Candidatus Saccharimonadales bacterium]|nr:hypothetical protein [Candidatus Saccharimonadales bacterium]
MQRHVQYLLQKEMSRKEFLLTLGFGLATLVGFSTLLQLLGKQNPWQRAQSGYGSKAYGGAERKEQL